MYHLGLERHPMHAQFRNLDYLAKGIIFVCYDV